MPSLAELEQWMEEQLPPNLVSGILRRHSSRAADSEPPMHGFDHQHDLPMKVTATIQSYSSHLYSQLYDLTPSYSQIESSIESSLHSIPFVGAHCTPTPPPPPPPPSVGIIDAIMQRADAFTGNRTRTSFVASIGVVGLTWAVLTRSSWVASRLRRRVGVRSPMIINGSRQEAIIILGADTPLGQSLCHHLSAQGFIILASVTDEDSMHVFDSLIPPSSRGYIKAIVLDPFGKQAEGIDHFVQSIASAKELRWPLTSAGDPYSRPGTEVQFTALINALSYVSVADKSSTSMTSPLHFDQLSQEMTMRVTTPISTLKALLPHLSTANKTSTIFVLSLIAPDSDMTSQALVVGMKNLKQGCPSRILFTTLQAKTSSLQGRALSFLPSMIGGAAPLHQTEIKSPPSSLASSRVADTKGQVVDRTTPTRPTNSSRSASTSDIRLLRSNEFKPILQAVTGIVLKPINTSTLRTKYTVQLPASISSQVQQGRSMQHTMLLNAIRFSSVPFVVLASALSRINMNPSCWLSSWNRSSLNYRGSRNAANSRPAYGPGPGPASNTHSRSCIRPSSDHSRSSRRPRSANSAASSEATKSTEANSTGPPSTTATASGPPSNNGMSSSGLLSSVPSSAFGDGSEEEQFDFEDGSPIQGSGPWASPIASDHDSDTALGARTDEQNETEATPSGSRANIEEVQYGFPSQASMQNSGEESWMGPASRGSPNPSERSAEGRSFDHSAVPGTPLGQSWVAIDDSH